MDPSRVLSVKFRENGSGGRKLLIGVSPPLCLPALCQDLTDITEAITEMAEVGNSIKYGGGHDRF